MVYGVGQVAHQGAHTLTALLLGGTVELVTSIGVDGDWRRAGEAGDLLVQLSGSFANLAFALAGWLALRTRRGRPDAVAFVAWVMFAVNAWMACAYAAASAGFGFGDWDVILDGRLNEGPLRAAVVSTALMACGMLMKETVTALAWAVGNGRGPSRVALARSLTRVIWLAGGAVSVIAGVFNPAGIGEGVGVAAVTSLGTTWPLMIAAKRIGEQPVPGTPLELPRSPLLLTGGAVVAALLILLFGPGLPIG